MKSVILLSCASALIAAPLSAQVTAPAAAVVTPATMTTNAPVPSIAPSTQAVLRAQTPVSLKMMEELTTQKKVARVGQRFKLEVSEPVLVNGVVVVPAGTPAVGEITQVKNKGMWGKSGYINAQLVQMRVGDRTIRLSGTFDDKGVTGTGGVVAAVAFLPIAGFFTTGTSARIPMGSGVKGFVDEDVPLALASAPMAPMAVSGTPAAMPVATAPAAAAAPDTNGGFPAYVGGAPAAQTTSTATPK